MLVAAIEIERLGVVAAVGGNETAVAVLTVVGADGHLCLISVKGLLAA